MTDDLFGKRFNIRRVRFGPFRLPLYVYEVRGGSLPTEKGRCLTFRGAERKIESYHDRCYPPVQTLPFVIEPYGPEEWERRRVLWNEAVIHSGRTDLELLAPQKED